MEFEEWQEYVNKVASYSIPIPPDFIKDYNDWHCRSIVGRMLFIMQDIEGAMRVLSTVRDIEIDMDQYPDYGLSDAEHKCLCLRDLGEIVWLAAQKAEAALYYFEQAYAICCAYKHPLHSAKRGAIWARILDLKFASGRQNEALQECLAKMQEQQPEGVNQYLFYGNKFLAERFAEKGDFEKANAHFVEGFKYYPLSDAGRRDLAEAAAEPNAEEGYKKYQHCATLQYRPWEKSNAPTLEEVRAKQHESYLKRLEREARGETTNLKINIPEY